MIREPCPIAAARLRAESTSRGKVDIPPGVDHGIAAAAAAAKASPAPTAVRPATATALSTSPSIRCSSATGSNLICQVPITYSQAALGAKIEVPTLDGRRTVEFPPAPSRAKSSRCAAGACPTLHSAVAAIC